MAADPLGWAPFAQRMETQVGGYTDIPDDGLTIDGIISHVAGGFMGGLISMAQDPNCAVSWHFSIGRDGRILQHRSIADPAYHAGIVNTPSWVLLKGRNPNKCTVGIEHEGFSIPASYADYVYSASKPWPEPLIQASIKVHEWIFATENAWYPGHFAPSENTVITHSMTDQRTRAQDPGDLWLATVRPRIIAALQPAPAPPTVDDFGRGRREMFNEWVRNAQRHRDDAIAREDAHLAWVKSREQEWSIP